MASLLATRQATAEKTQKKFAVRGRSCQEFSDVKLIILHNHFRPGGVRRVIELAAPHLVAALGPGPVEVLLLGGESPDDRWLSNFHDRLRGTRVECGIDPALGYLAEQRPARRLVEQRIRNFLAGRLGEVEAQRTVVWAHNQGLARNLLLTRELVKECARRDLPLVLHHHDWWFDNRWRRWPEVRGNGFKSIPEVAQTVFAHQPNVRHAVINRADHAILQRHLGPQCGWMPNLMPQASPPKKAAVQAARRWLDDLLAETGAPVWLVPCRLLRRKNLAEALLLTRWLRPEAFLITSGGVSSAEEQPYHEKLAGAARKHGWRARLGVLAGDESSKPGMPELIAASEVLLLTSIQEGFGLPYLEAAVAQRPLIARSLANIAPDLKTFGLRFPQYYEEIRVSPTLFDWETERARQLHLFRTWLRLLPPELGQRTVTLDWLVAGPTPDSVPFSRLTLSAQIEVLSHPAEVSWNACLPFNRMLAEWRQRARQGRLQVTPWPESADTWLSGEAYATAFTNLLRASITSKAAPALAMEVQRDFLRRTLASSNQYPLLWHTDT